MVYHQNIYAEAAVNMQSMTADELTFKTQIRHLNFIVTK